MLVRLHIYPTNYNYQHTCMDLLSYSGKEIPTRASLRAFGGERKHSSLKESHFMRF